MTTHKEGSDNFRLLAEGSDPEYMYYNTRTFSAVEAASLSSSSRVVFMSSPVGADGHPMTAEIRPMPAHNVGWHLLKIADLLGGVNEFLSLYNNKHGTDIVAVAQPVFSGEPLGGHIHISGIWQNRPREAEAARARYVHYAGGVHLYGTRESAGIWTGRDLARFQADVADGKVVGLDNAVKRIHYLVAPFEEAKYGASRAGRTGIDLVRPAGGFEFPPDLPPDAFYVRFEYRYPSTWLGYPELAYCYLGLAKLAMLNWNLLEHATYGRHRTEPRTLFANRFKEIWGHPKARVSRDLYELPDLVFSVLDQRETDPILINFPAWQKYYARGGE